MSTYGKAPADLGLFDFDLKEVMYYLYLPAIMPGGEARLPPNVGSCTMLVAHALRHAYTLGRDIRQDYVYLSARKGWATPDNPLNRPGWHADGFGTDDLNYVWWVGPGTRFLIGDLGEVPEDHRASMKHFEWLGNLGEVPKHFAPRDKRKIKADYPERHLYALDPFVVHATPLIGEPCWRQYVKVSISRHRYNLENNSHNYLFDYEWPLHSREEVRNDTHRAQRDYA